MVALPDAAGTTRKPHGAVTITSSSAHSPFTTCSRVKRALRPSSTSTFARPKSASSNIVLRPWAASAAPRFTATTVLPTPPLPPVIAITLTGCGVPSRRKPAAWSMGPSRMRCQLHLAEIHRELVLVERRRALRELHRVVHEPEALWRREVQVLWHALAVREIRNRQADADRERQHAAECGRLVELRDHERLG